MKTEHLSFQDLQTPTFLEQQKRKSHPKYKYSSYCAKQGAKNKFSKASIT